MLVMKYLALLFESMGPRVLIFNMIFLQEQLDGAGIELPKLFSLIESRAPDCCSTEAWKRRIHWVGGQLSNDLNEAINDAEKYLQSCRPVRR